VWIINKQQQVGLEQSELTPVEIVTQDIDESGNLRTSEIVR